MLAFCISKASHISKDFKIFQEVLRKSVSAPFNSFNLAVKAMNQPDHVTKLYFIFI